MESFLALLFVLAFELLICGSGLDRSPRGKVELPAHEAAHLLDAIFQEQIVDGDQQQGDEGGKQDAPTK
jgi:hypothetical protein